MNDSQGYGAAPRELLAFFALTYAVMWTFFIVVAAGSIPAKSPVGTLLLLVGVFAPSIVAIGFAARAGGRAGIERLVAPVFHWRVSARWYLFAVAYFPSIKLTAALLHRLIAGEWPPIDTDALYFAPFAIAFSTPVQAGEEIGWRGYALPRLTARFGLPLASIILGLIWAAWHLPQFFIREADTYRQSFVVYALQVTALSVAMAWLYAKTNGSLLLVMLMHAAVNNTKDIVPSGMTAGNGLFSLNSSLVAWLTATLLWIVAGHFLARMSGRRAAALYERADAVISS